jgi:hypothetical protein
VPEINSVVPFYSDEIEACWNEERQEPDVSITCLAQNMGLDAKAQRRKVLAHPVLSKHVSRAFMALESKRGERENLAIPLRLIPTWLNTIIPSRAKPEARERIILYQEEAADVEKTAHLLVAMTREHLADLGD